MHKSMSVALVRATHCPCSSSNSPLLFWHKSVADTRGSSSNNCVLTTYKEGVLLPLLCLSCGIICVSSGARNIAPAVPAASFVVFTQRPLPFRNSRVCGTRSAESEPGDLGLSCSYCHSYISYRLANPIQMPAGPLWIFGSLPANGVCDSAIVLDMRHSWTQLFLSRLRKMFKT